MRRLFLVTACIAWAVGCPSSEEDASDDDASDGGHVDHTHAGSGGGSGTTDASVAGSNDIVGHINVKLTPPTPTTPLGAAKVGSTSVSGKVYDAPLPSATVWDMTAEAGDCKLLEPRAPFCDPPCSGGVCVEEDECTPNPTAHSLGTLHVTGLKTTSGATAFDIEPINNNYMNSADASLPYPAFEEGDAIGFTSSGGDYAPLSAMLDGIAPLELTGDAYDLTKDKPLLLKWTPPASGAQSRIAVQLDISHHGGSKGKIECDSADSGSLEIAASLVTQLIDLGVAGFPTVIVTRGASTTAPIAPGLVEFQVSMAQERSVSVPGLSSCTSDGDCQDGKKCQTDLTCQ